jgi:hypothetical protein
MPLKPSYTLSSSNQGGGGLQPNQPPLVAYRTLYRNALDNLETSDLEDRVPLHAACIEGLAVG